VARERSGKAYDPAIVECFLEVGPELLAHAGASDAWARVVDSELVERPALSEEEIDDAARAMADFVDLKSRYTLGHSSGVASLAEGAARELRLAEADVVELRRAGLLHDLGRAAVTTSVWDKAQPLSAEDWERIRLHAYRSERALARPAALARLGALAGAHHERIDGSGYHRGSPASMQPLGVRVLAAADAYRAMTEPRPHRPAFGVAEAAEELRREVRAGRHDGDAVRAVLVAAGHPAPEARGEGSDALPKRDVEVLNLLARGFTHRGIAERLFVAQEAVDQHVQHLFAKLGCTTTAAATFLVLEHGLLDVGPETTVRPRN
jgi:response regulator RpfG family c-di-GMP phosphodiesterase/DNA-binding CsgD family transcriptional regulator